MAASPNLGGNVYNRNASEDLHKAWNAVIRKVNEERANPPENTNCDELGPIAEAETDHIWTKQDIEALRDAIDEMCEYPWVEELVLWHDEIIAEIDGALDRELGGWGGENECCKEECLADCDNATDENVEIYWGIYSVTGCSANPEPDDRWAQARLAEEAGARCATAIDDWIGYWGAYCVLVGAVEGLEEELENLQTQLTVLEEIRDEECAKEPPNRCAGKQADVDEKQEEVDAKQDELDAKETERDEKLAEADEAESDAESEAASSMAYADASAPAGTALLYSSMVGEEPWTNTACDELGPACLGKDPARCRATWSCQRLPHQYHCLGWEWHSDHWNPQMNGGYTMSGKPYTTWINGVAGLPTTVCVAFGPNACDHGIPCGETCAIDMEYEARFTQTRPRTHPPDNEVCC